MKMNKEDKKIIKDKSVRILTKLHDIRKSIESISDDIRIITVVLADSKEDNTHQLIYTLQDTLDIAYKSLGIVSYGIDNINQEIQK